MTAKTQEEREKEAREARLAEALRANLRRRKQQARESSDDGQRPAGDHSSDSVSDTRR